MQKPARYIGCEDGAQRPDHGPGKVAWLLIYPDTYEIGLPNQGLQILYEILNERADAVAERSYAPWTDLEAAAARASDSRSSRSTATGRPREFDLLAFNLSAELVYTNVLNCIDLAGVPGAGRRPAPPTDPLVVRRRPLHLQPRAAGRLRRPVRASATARRWSARSPRWSATGRPGAHRRGPGEAVLRRPGPVPGVYVPSMYEVAYDGERLAGGHAALPRRARAGREAHHRRPGRLALPEAASWCP